MLTSGNIFQDCYSPVFNFSTEIICVTSPHKGIQFSNELNLGDEV